MNEKQSYDNDVNDGCFQKFMAYIKPAYSNYFQSVSFATYQICLPNVCVILFYFRQLCSVNGCA